MKQKVKGVSEGQEGNENVVPKKALSPESRGNFN